MLKNGQAYFKNFAGRTPQDFQSMFDHFSKWKKELKERTKPFKSSNLVPRAFYSVFEQNHCF